METNPCLIPLRDPLARGTIWGLTPRHEIGHLLRAVYEGTAYGNRHILEKLETLGVPTQRIVASGGGTRSTLWMQILADVAGLPITLTETADAVSLGSAMCAAVGAGVFANLHEASRAMVHPSRTIEPNPSTHARLSRKIRALQRNLRCPGPPFPTCQQQVLSLSLLLKRET